MSIAMLGGGAARASYYLDRSADCAMSAYYSGEPERPGVWCGAGAKSLGLVGRVTGSGAAAFAALLDGALPDGTQVARPVLRQDPNRPDGARVDIRRCALDLVVSAPKSVSVLFALADPQTAAVVTAAHEHAVREALGYLDRNASHGLRGHQGGEQRATRITTDGLVAAAFNHVTSRADDPQLHTHLVVANLLHGTDGKWTAVDSRAVHRHARTAGCIYQAVLRGELTTHLGVSWEPVRRGVAEITGIPKTLLTEFSTRRRAIEDELDRTGGSGRKAAQRAAYVTRPAKSHAAELPLREQWAARAETLGHRSTDVVDRAVSQTPCPELPSITTVGRELFGPDGLTGQATSFDRRDVLQALTETLPAGVATTGAQLETAADRLLTDDDAIPLLNPAARSGERRWSTRDLLAAENWAINVSQQPTAIPVIPADVAAGIVSSTALSAEQQAVVTGLLSSPDLVDVVIGPAGSGKTAALRAAGDAWQAQGVPVIGCALAAITARRLEAATGVPCSSISRLLGGLDRLNPATGQPTGLEPYTVVLADEASMVGTRHHTRLLTHVHAAGGKLVLIGDPAQLSEIDAGGMFTALARQRPPLSLTGNQRQRHDWERQALVNLRHGHIDDALDQYLAHGRIHLGTTPNRTRHQIAQDYLAHRAQHHDPYAVVALAPTRDDATALNTAIRDQLRTTSRLGPDTTTVNGPDGPQSYATGDLVIVTRNDHHLGLLNGTRATLTHTSRDQLTLQTDDGKNTTVPASWAAGHLDHGYAMTVHKAQGLTTNVALLYGTAALCQQSGYVGLSRGTEHNHLYASHASLLADHAGLEIPPAFELLGPDPDHVTQLLAQQLGMTHRHTLARDQTPGHRDHEPTYPPLRHHTERRDRGLSR